MQPLWYTWVMAERTRQSLHSGGSLWGPERVVSGVSIKQLAAAAKINHGFLSRMENGYMFPKPEEYARITSALKRLQAEKATTLEPSATAEG